MSSTLIRSIMYLFCFAIIVASLLGGFVPMLFHLTHRRMQLAMSGIAGVMAGIAVLDLLPEALEVGETHYVMQWLLGGFLCIFILERFIPSHCHDVSEDNPEASCCHEHRLTWIGTFVGLTIHSLLAGIALAASWQAGGFPVAIGVFIAILLHKPFDGLTLVSMMRLGKVVRNRVHFMNVLFAFMVPLGVIGFVLLGEASPDLIAGALAFSAGMFLCISLCDLLPELQFHGHDKFGLTVALLLGLGVSYGITKMHSHDQPHHEHHHHTHDDHDHDHTH
ncbi:MAG: ZIP family metal transporter [Planctomycetota bacterium]|nr:ZIP family metal transporter [Planctomycetota bacterium]